MNNLEKKKSKARTQEETSGDAQEAKGQDTAEAIAI